MRRFVLIFTLLIAVLAAGSTAVAKSPANGANRQVVFEGFLRPT